MPDATPEIELARKLEQSISLAPMPTGTGVESVNCGTFRAWFTSYTDNPQLNYAMPVALTDPAALGADVDALRALFAARARKVRVEFVEELWPALADALQRAGLHLQAREPLMACMKSEFAPVAAPGVSVRLLSADEQRCGPGRLSAHRRRTPGRRIASGIRQGGGAAAGDAEFRQRDVRDRNDRRSSRSGRTVYRAG